MHQVIVSGGTTQASALCPHKNSRIDLGALPGIVPFRRSTCLRLRFGGDPTDDQRHGGAVRGKATVGAAWDWYDRLYMIASLWACQMA